MLPVRGWIIVPIASIAGARPRPRRYTGNTAFVTTALYEKKASARDLIKNWSMSYLGNFLGSLFMVAMVVSTGLLASSAVPANMAVAKTSIPWMQVRPFLSFALAAACALVS